MGAQIEYNWILKINDNNLISNAKNETTSRCTKNGYRFYPLDIPIDLVNSNWEVLFKVVIKKIIYYNNMTEIFYIILKKYSLEERKVLTSEWRNNINYVSNSKGEGDIIDYGKYRITK